MYLKLTLDSPAIHGDNVVWIIRGTGSLQTPDLCNDEKKLTTCRASIDKDTYAKPVKECFRLCCSFRSNKRLKLGLANLELRVAAAGDTLGASRLFYF